MKWQMGLVLAAVLATSVFSLPSAASAHHKDQGHSGYLFPYRPTANYPAPIDQYEMSTRTVNRQPVRIINGFAPATWGALTMQAVTAYNSAFYQVTNFNVYSYEPGDATVNAGSDVNQCRYLADGVTPAHGCLLADTWAPNTPSAVICMNEAAIGGNGTHRKSDLLHEMGHLLWNAGEHYPGDCSSIMDHCLSTTIGAHDRTDLQDAYRIGEAPDAAYLQLTSSSSGRHFFEGSYWATGDGTGFTLHAEANYVIDQSTTGLCCTYSFFASPSRQINNGDDGTPNSYDKPSLPGLGQEWCFKTRGEAGAIPGTALYYHWGPYSRAYCVARSGPGSGVYIVSARNDYVSLRVWNYSGATINNVVITRDDQNKTQLCNFGNVSANASPGCIVYLGSGSNYVNLYYNNGWLPQDYVG